MTTTQTHTTTPGSGRITDDIADYLIDRYGFTDQQSYDIAADTINEMKHRAKQEQAQFEAKTYR